MDELPVRSEQTLEEGHGPTPSDQNLNDQSDQLSEEWETMARAWLCSFPEAKAVSMDEVEAWIDSNLDSLPEGIKSMPRSDLCQRLIAIQNCMRLPSQVPLFFSSFLLNFELLTVPFFFYFLVQNLL